MSGDEALLLFFFFPLLPAARRSASLSNPFSLACAVFFSHGRSHFEMFHCLTSLQLSVYPCAYVLQVEQVTQLSSFVESLVQYHRQALQVLEELNESLGRRSVPVEKDMAASMLRLQLLACDREDE